MKCLALSVLLFWQLVADPVVNIPTLPGRTDVLGDGLYYVATVKDDPLWAPSTLRIGPWRSLPLMTQGVIRRPAEARIASDCPGKTHHCTNPDIYLEVRFHVYYVEDQNHSRVFRVCVEGNCTSPYIQSRFRELNEGWTTDLPKNWMPGSDGRSPQIPVSGYYVGGEFDAPTMRKILAKANILVGDWSTSASPALLSDMEEVLRVTREAP